MLSNGVHSIGRSSLLKYGVRSVGRLASTAGGLLPGIMVGEIRVDVFDRTGLSKEKKGSVGDSGLDECGVFGESRDLPLTKQGRSKKH